MRIHESVTFCERGSPGQQQWNFLGRGEVQAGHVEVDQGIARYPGRDEVDQGIGVCREVQEGVTR